MGYDLGFDPWRYGPLRLHRIPPFRDQAPGGWIQPGPLSLSAGAFDPRHRFWGADIQWVASCSPFVWRWWALLKIDYQQKGGQIGKLHFVGFSQAQSLSFAGCKGQCGGIFVRDLRPRTDRVSGSMVFWRGVRFRSHFSRCYASEHLLI